jgi:hypothetical protein
MNPSELVALHLQIDTSMKSILRDGKLDKHDIPQLVFVLSELMLTPTPTTANKLTPEMLITRMNELYAYVMSHYKLYPEDDLDKAAYQQLFDTSVKLLVYNPKLIKAAKSCMPCIF